MRRIIEKFLHGVEEAYIIHAQPLTVIASSRHVKRMEELPERHLLTKTPLAPLRLDVKVEFYSLDGLPVYFITEPPVTRFVRRLYQFIRQRLGEVSVEPGRYLQFIRNMFEDMGIDPSVALADKEVKAAVYYAYRDVFGYGPLEPMMLDPFVEEVSWYGHDYPVVVVDKQVMELYPRIQFIYTNMMFDPSLPEHERKYLMTVVIRAVAAKAKSGLTVAKPLSEGRIPDPSGKGFHRLAAHLEVISRTSSVTIRKFPAVRPSLTELVAKNTLSPLLAAYLLLQLLYRGFIFIVGVMGSGKTTLLNALISALPATYKVITIEDTPELSTPAFNWHPLYTRYAPRQSELENVTFDVLLRHSLRHRGYIVTLGEVRDKEMATLIQAVASGHGAVATFHSENPFEILMRMITPPINAPPVALKMITSVVNIALTVTFKEGYPKNVRRVVRVYEIIDVSPRRLDVKYSTVFEWNPYTDEFTPDYPAGGLNALAELYARSRTLKELGRAVYPVEPERILAEVAVITHFIRALVKRQVFDIREVNTEMTRMYVRFDKLVDEYWRRYGDALRRLVREKAGGAA